MINVPNWEERKKRYEQYWNRENKTPILFLCAPKDGEEFEMDFNVSSETGWFDVDWAIRAARDSFRCTYYGGDAYPHTTPSLGPDILSAMLGLKVTYNETSAWVTHLDKELSEITDFTPDKTCFHYTKMVEFLTKYAEDAKNGDYIVGMVDLNSLMDGVASLIGPDNLCYEMVDNPDDVKRVTKGLLDMFKEIYTEYNNMVIKYQGGNTNWLSVYSDIPWYYITCDFMVMVSPDFFDEFIDKPLREMIDFLPRSMFHLDGENAIFHLDKLLAIENLNAIQVQATPYMQSTKFWIPYIQKIQAAGKCVWIEARNKEEILELMENCKPEGLFIKSWCNTQAEAEEIEQMVKDYYKL